MPFHGEGSVEGYKSGYNCFSKAKASANRESCSMTVSFLSSSAAWASGVNALMTSNEVAKDDKAIIKLNRFRKWLNEFADAKGMNEVK